MCVKYNEKEKLFVLETKHSCYQIKVDKTGCLRHLYYGRSVGPANMDYRYRARDRGFSGNPYEQAGDRACSFDTMPQEYSCYGTGDYRISAIMTEAENGSRSIDLRYESFAIEDGKYTLEGLPYVRAEEDHVQTLRIRLKDHVTGTAVVLCYGVFEEKDVITRTAQVVNESDQRIRLKKAASVCLDLPYGTYDLIHFSGKHCMERQMQRQAIAQDIVTVGARRGMSSHHNNPFVILCDPHADEDQGSCCGIMLMYSGNHKEEIEKDQTGSVRIVAGIHDDGFSWLLQPGGAFQTPEAVLSFSDEGLNGLSRHFHRIIRENICDRRYLQDKKPVLINSWETAYFDFNEEAIYDLAVQAKDLGIEMVVMDDGWFGRRNDDLRSLGDWYVNEKKIRGGLKKLVDRINGLGLKFGIWVEPEMVNEDSDLYRRHPDWALKDPGRKPMLARNQLVLDMSREDVREYLFGCLSSLLSESNIEYVKWDFNRGLANVYSNALPAEQQGEAPHRFVLGLYELLARLKEAFPHVLIEGCAGGGGRFDAGMLFYTPQIWCSDNTDPISRAKIQRGTSYGYPACTMGSHVSASPNHQTGRKTPLTTRGIVASSGTFGYELNPGLLSKEEKVIIRAQIGDYHKYYSLIQNGDYYRLGSEAFNEKYSCWEFVSGDKSEALVNIVAFDVEANAPFPYVKLRGLEEASVYQLEGTDLRVPGAALMYGGYTFDVFSGNYPSARLHFIRCDEK